MTPHKTFTKAFVVASLLTATCAVGLSQTPETGASFQYFVNDQRTPGNIAVRMEGLGNTAAGRPFSATEERTALQVLGDGTRIERKDTDKYFRDLQGRIRIERNNGKSVSISDPVAGFSADLNTEAHAAHKMMFFTRATRGPSGIARFSDGVAPQFEIATGNAATLAAPTVMAIPAGVISAQPFAGADIITGAVSATISGQVNLASNRKPAPPEDLGTRIVNGVPAQGSRFLITIPVGEIGNDREMKIVSESWYSADLQMLIKSSNNDPRFGETSYALTNIVQGAQDPALFQIPPDFTVNPAGSAVAMPLK